MTTANSGTVATNHHLIDGLPWKVSTFMPKKPLTNVNGRKMNVIHDKRHMLNPNCKLCLASLMPTLLYMRSERLAVGLTTPSWNCVVSFSSSSADDVSQCSFSRGSPSAISF